MSNLILLFVTPFFMSLIAFLMPVIPGKSFKRLAVAMSLLPLIILILGHSRWIGSSVQYHWLPALSIQFYLSIDSLSLLFLYLIAVIVPISLLTVKGFDLKSPNFFYGLVLLLEGILIGFFTARDLVVFTVFWESMLLPLFFIINFWGGEHKRSAAFKFILYMFAGSALMVAAVLALYFIALSSGGIHTFNLDQLAKISEGAPYAHWICAIFLLAFAVKTPLFPFHAWLPDAYCQAPTAGSILLAAVLSKAGIYGIIRIVIQFFPTIIQEWGPLLSGFAIAGVFYGGLAAWRQNDFKRLIAYSSFSHVNFILVGLFVWNQTAHSGAILQALNHSITITALFLVSGWLEERLGTTHFGRIKGLAKFMPQLCWITFFFVMSSVALPGTNNFVGELMILYGLFSHNAWAAAFLCLSVILSVIYMLRWMQNTYFETPSDYERGWIDIKGKEMLVALPLILLILWVGIYPTPVLNLIKPATANTETIAMLEEPR